MKKIGIIGRAYYNKDNQKIIQINEDIRKYFADEQVVTIALLPPSNIYYIDLDKGMDEIKKQDEQKLLDVLDLCDGFIIPGGTNWYQFDEFVIQYAISHDKPLLAICLGFQALCSMFACDREKFDMTTRLTTNDHYGSANEYQHEIQIVDNTILKRILKSSKIKVNSVHHDIANFPFKELKISALSPDNIIEAVELPNKKFIIGVQWHPEYLIDEYSQKIRDAFIKVL